MIMININAYSKIEAPIDCAEEKWKYLIFNKESKNSPSKDGAGYVVAEDSDLDIVHSKQYI